MKKFICVFLVICVLFLNGCTGNIPEKLNSSKTVATSFFPVYIFTLNLLKDIEEIKVECMAEQSVGCLHDYTLTAKDAKLLSDAVVLVVNGAGMESFLHDAFDSVENLKVIDSSENTEIICADEHHHENDTHNHNHQGNSHIWLSIENAKVQVKNIKQGLIKEFPEHQKTIENNYKDYVERLNLLIEERNLLSSKLKDFSVVSFHGAYEYLGEEIGFEIKTTIESDEGSEPSAKELAHLSSLIKEEKVNALFVSPDYNGSAAEILQRETNTSVYVINPVISGEAMLTAYEDIMKENYETILKAVK